MITGVASTELLVQDADKRHITLAPATWQAIRDSFNMAVDTLKSDLGLDKLDPGGQQERAVEAGRRAWSPGTSIRWWPGRHMLRMPPGLLAWDMRGNSHVSINGVGLKHAVDLAVAKTGGDSVSGALQKAPGPAPMPAPDGAAPPAPPAKSGGDTVAGRQEAVTRRAIRRLARGAPGRSGRRESARVRPGVAGPRRGPGPPGDTVVDRIAAVVGNTAIPMSRVSEEVFTLQQTRQQQGLPLLQDSAAIRALTHQVLDTLIAVELMYQQARNDTSIKVTDQEVTDAVEAQVRNLRKQTTSVDNLNSELNRAGFKSLDDYRQWLATQQRRQLYISRFQQELSDNKTIKPINPTEKEMRAFYKANLPMFGDVPATVSFKQIVIAPRPDSAATARTIVLADSIIAELRKGASFGQAARRYSMDPTTAADSGDLGWFPHGKMVPAFDKVAFALPVGQISNPVVSEFGIHIIQVLRREPTEVHARHILLVPPVDSADAAKAHALADSISGLLARGASFDSLQKLYTDQVEEKEVDETPLPGLPDAYNKALAGLDSGQTTPGLCAGRFDRRPADQVGHRAGHRARAGRAADVRVAQAPHRERTQPAAWRTDLHQCSFAPRRTSTSACRERPGATRGDPW